MESIKNRFLIAVSLIVVVTMLLSTIITLNVQRTALEEDRALNVGLSVSAMTGVIGPALWDFQDDIVSQSVGTAFKNPNISRVVVKDATGALKYGLIRGEEEGQVIEVADLSGASDGDDEHLSQYPLKSSGGEDAGKLTILINDDLIEHRLNQQLWAALIQGGSIMALVILTLIFSLQSLIFSHLNTIGVAFKEIAEGEGDLSKRIDYNKKNEIGVLVHYFNLFISKMHTAVSDVDSISHSLTSASVDLQQINQSSVTRVDNSKQETTMVATAVHELSTATEEIARNAGAAADKADEVNKEANNTRNVVNSTVETIDGLSDKIKHGADVIHSLQSDVQNIVSVLDVIRGIADQTNLLALNAAIEAARAGEQGRGFAVVADEVRALASRTQDSTTEIQGMIERLEQGSSQAVEVMDSGNKASAMAVDKAREAFASLDIISQGIEVISDFSTQIATAVAESSEVTREINVNVNNINDLAEELVSCTSDSNQAGQKVDSDIESLKNMLSKFKL
ncbi:MAG: methyl-accepting chemotaxis protein [Phenylobacterium sp.]|jgi:methyl-accepting chemotaxis protein